MSSNDYGSSLREDRDGLGKAHAGRGVLMPDSAVQGALAWVDPTQRNDLTGSVNAIAQQPAGAQLAAHGAMIDQLAAAVKAYRAQRVLTLQQTYVVPPTSKSVLNYETAIEQGD